MCGEIQSDESKRKEWAREFDDIIVTCNVKTRFALCTAIKEKIPFMFDMENKDWDYPFRNEVAFNRINLAIRNAQNAQKEQEQLSLI